MEGEGNLPDRDLTTPLVYDNPPCLHSDPFSRERSGVLGRLSQCFLHFRAMNRSLCHLPSLVSIFPQGEREKYGWGEARAKIYHRLHISTTGGNKYGVWKDCNGWERKPHDQRPTHLMPCKKCLYAEWYFAMQGIRIP